MKTICGESEVKKKSNMKEKLQVRENKRKNNYRKIKKC